MSSHFSVLLLITLWASVQDGFGLPLMKSQEVEEANDDVPANRVRSKRCACSSPLDSECHYFCHLDIIWINTPSKTTIYGLGSVLSRRRRSSGRCTCINPNNLTCSNFCGQRAVASRSKTVQGASYSGAHEALEALEENTR